MKRHRREAPRTETPRREAPRTETTPRRESPRVTSSPPRATSPPPRVTSSPPRATSSPPRATSPPPRATSSPPRDSLGRASRRAPPPGRAGTRGASRVAFVRGEARRFARVSRRDARGTREGERVHRRVVRARGRRGGGRPLRAGRRPERDASKKRFGIRGLGSNARRVAASRGRVRRLLPRVPVRAVSPRYSSVSPSATRVRVAFRARSRGGEGAPRDDRESSRRRIRRTRRVRDGGERVGRV